MRAAFLLDTPPSDAYLQMALDEALLDSAEPDACYLRIYRWPGTGIAGVTFGYFQRYEDVAAAVRKRAGALTFPLVRRLTGGGTVYHDGDITFSFVFPWPRLVAPSLVYKNIHLGVHLGLKSHAMASRLWSPREKPALGARAECFAAPEPIDLVHEDGRKALGGALRRRKGFGLYQGSLRPEGFAFGADRLRQALLDGFSLQWSALFRPAPFPSAAAAAAPRLQRECYRTDAWNRCR